MTLLLQNSSRHEQNLELLCGSSIALLTWQALDIPNPFVFFICVVLQAAHTLLRRASRAARSRIPK